MYLTKKIGIGDLRERISIYTYSIGRAANGEETVSFSEWKKAWAHWDWTEGRAKEVGEKDHAGREFNIEDAWVTIRYMQGTKVDEKMRIYRDGEFFDILAIQNDSAKRFINLVVRRRKTTS